MRFLNFFLSWLVLTSDLALVTILYYTQRLIRQFKIRRQEYIRLVRLIEALKADF